MTQTLAPAPAAAPRSHPARPTRLRRRSWAFNLTAISGLGLIVRVAWVASTRHTLALAGDAYYYHYQANLLASGHGFIEPLFYNLSATVRPSAYHPPLYVLYLAAFSVVGLKSWFVHRLASCLLGAATVALVGVLGRRLAGPRVGLVAAGLAALYPLIWINDGLGLSEAVVMPACALALVLAYRLIDKPSPGRAVALGGACGLAALARSEQVLLCVVLIVPVVLLLRRSRRERVTLLAVAAVGMGAMLAPWVIRDLVSFDHPVLLSTNFEATLAVSNCAHTYDRRDALYAFWDIECIPHTRAAGDESDDSVVLRHQALTFLEHHKREAVIVALARLGRELDVFRPLETAQLDRIEGRPLWASHAGLAGFAVLVPLAVGGAVVLRRRRIPLAPLLALPVTVTLTAVLIYADTRFRAPAELSLVILAAVALDHLARQVRAAPASPAATGGLAAAPAPGVPVEASTAPPTSNGAAADTSRLVPGTLDQHGRVVARFPCFDGYRALAAFMVFGVHVTFLAGFTARHYTLGLYTSRLDAGVALFFLISGFLLYRPFVAAHLADRPEPRLGPFLRRRALRIIPAYWVALTVITFVFHEASIKGPKDALVYYGFAQIYAGGKYLGGGITQAWSLDTELTFYLFLPLWAFILRTVARRRAAAARQQVAWELAGCALLYFGSLLWRTWLVEARYQGKVGIDGALYWLPSTMDLFALGMALAVVSAWSAHRPHPGPSRLVETAGRRPWVWWVAAAVAYWAVSTRLGLPRDFRTLSTGQWVGREILYGVFALFMLVPGIFGPQDRGLVRRFLRLWPIQALGLVSYAFYLWHTTAIVEFRTHMHYRLFRGNFLGTVAVSLFFSIAVSTASWVLIERPALRWKGRG